MLLFIANKNNVSILKARITLIATEASMKTRAYILSIAVLALLTPCQQARPDSPVKKPFWTPVTELVSQSRLAYLFEKHIQSRIASGIVLGSQPASEKYQEFARQAQIDVEIPEEFHVPCTKLAEGSPLEDIVGAIAFSDSIIVNEKRVDKTLYGNQRISLYHEAIHKKNNDFSLDTIIEFGTLLSAGFLAHKGLKWINPQGKSRAFHLLCVGIASLSASLITSAQYKKMCERRADIDAIYAADCAECAREFAVRRTECFEVEKNPIRFNGYLWPNEISLIAYDLNAQGKLCAHHKEHITQGI